MSSGQEVGQIFGSGVGPATALLRSPTVIIASIALWGMNIYFFRLFGIDYVRVLNGGKSPSSVSAKELSPSPDGGNGLKTSTSDTDNVNDTNNGTQQCDKGDNKSSSTKTAILIDDIDKAAATLSSGSEVTAGKCISLAVFLLILLHLTEYFWVNIMRGGKISAIFAFYVTASFGAALPLRQTQWIRIAIGTVIYRVLQLVNPRCSCIGIKPPKPVPFVDVFFADAMCSMSKVFFDWGLLFLRARYYPFPVPATMNSIIIPSIFAALPYLIRARQCLVMYNIGKNKGDPKHYHHMLNTIKYTTSLFPICVSAYQKIDAEKEVRMENYLIMLLTVNSLYSYAWDVIMDWGMMQNPTLVLTESCVPGQRPNETPKGCAHACLRPRLRFGLCVSVGILLADGILRFSWTLRFYHHLIFPSGSTYILSTELFEAFRRAIWNLLRVEWENIKQVNALQESKDHSEKKEEHVAFLSTLPLIQRGTMQQPSPVTREPPE